MKKPAMLIEKSLEVLGDYDKVTLRQLYYRLVSAQIIPNTLNEYKGLSRVLAKARYAGVVPFDAFEDLNRTAKVKGEYVGIFTPEAALKDIIGEVKRTLEWGGTYYKGHPFWRGQDKYIEVWEEKQALQSQFEKALTGFSSDVARVTCREPCQPWWTSTLSPLDVTLVVCRGYPSVTLLYEAARRIQRIQEEDPEREVIIKYFGDFDPTGKDISRNVIETLEDEFGLEITFERVALERHHIDRYNLPPMPVKKKDARAKKYMEEYGDVAVELDALDPEILHEIIRESISVEIDSKILEERAARIEENREAIKPIVKAHDWEAVFKGVLEDL